MTAVYTAPGPADELSQGDVFDGCPVYTMAPPDDDRDGPLHGREYSLRVIVLTQACDIAQRKTDRIVVAPVRTAEEFVAGGLLKPAQIRDQVRSHRTFGLYFLPESPSIGLPESIVDVRDLYTIPRRLLDQQIAAGKRVCRPATPFREHLAQHFAVTYMRIALPEPYPTAP